MNSIQRQRLTTWRDALRSERVAAAWNYGTWRDDSAGAPGDACGTCGCAYGFLPTIFPDDWNWRSDFLCPMPKHPSDADSAARFAAEFFGISKGQAEYLASEVGFELRPPKAMRDVTPNDVADAIDAILARYE